MRALVIEMPGSGSMALELMLRTEKFDVIVADESEDGVDLATLYEYDVIILGEPGDMSGLQALRRIRLEKVTAPILMLGTGELAQFRARCLNDGADDYLLQPYHRDELVARLHALIRRSRGFSHARLTVGALSLDVRARTAWVGDTPFHTTPKEFRVLEVLLLRKGTAVSRDAFMEAIYDMGADDPPGHKILDVFVCKLRRKLRDLGADYIENVWGVGYILKPPRSALAA